MSASVAAGIAGSDQPKTGLYAVRLGLIGFLIPFFFLDNPILLIGVDPSATISATAWTLASALLGTASLVMGLEGWGFTRASAVERILLIFAAPFMLLPGLSSDFIGLGFFAAVVIFQFVRSRRNQASAAE